GSGGANYPSAEYNEPTIQGSQGEASSWDPSASSYVEESRRVIIPVTQLEPAIYERYREYYMPSDDQTSYPRLMVVNRPYKPPISRKS
ncbi:8699_t:CDS:1, partial [Acaulospora morrowiae]